MERRVWIRVYEKEECHLCEKVWPWIQALRNTSEIERIDIEHDLYWKKWYALHIPVIWIDGVVRLLYPFTEEELKRAYRYIKKNRRRQQKIYERFKHILSYFEQRSTEKGILAYWRKRYTHLVLNKVRENFSGQSLRVLELATGPAANDRWIPENWTVIHIDWVQTPVLHKHGQHYGLCADAHLLPFTDATFDVVISTFSFCAFLSPEVVLEEVHRVLKRGGVCFFVDHQLARGYWKYLLKALKPVWHAFAGCYPDRRISEFQKRASGFTWEHIESDRGFFIVWAGRKDSDRVLEN